jgi:hypothetical protein
LRKVVVRRNVKTTKVSEHFFDSMTTTDRAGDSRVGIARSKYERTSHLLRRLKKGEVEVENALLTQPPGKKNKKNKKTDHYLVK